MQSCELIYNLNSYLQLPIGHWLVGVGPRGSDNSNTHAHAITVAIPMRINTCDFVIVTCRFCALLKVLLLYEGNRRNINPFILYKQLIKFRFIWVNSSLQNVPDRWPNKSTIIDNMRPEGIGKNQHACYFFALHFIIISISDSQELVFTTQASVGTKPKLEF